MNKYIFFSITAFIIAAGLWLSRKEIYGLIVSRQYNEAAAGFLLQDLNGNRLDFTDFDGKVLVLEFWNTW